MSFYIGATIVILGVVDGAIDYFIGYSSDQYILFRNHVMAVGVLLAILAPVLNPILDFLF